MSHFGGISWHGYLLTAAHINFFACFKVVMNTAFGHFTIGFSVADSFGVSRPRDVTGKHWQQAPASDSPSQQVTYHPPAPGASYLKW